MVVITALVWKISQENERGGGLEIAPPSGARVNTLGVRGVFKKFAARP